MAGRGTQRPKLSESQNNFITDLSDLSNCHSCKRRTGISIRRDNLIVLESQWRIVLLCMQCHERVESAQLCSYCLTDITPPPLNDNKVDGWGSVHKCTQCNRQIHEECILGYSNLAPFSFPPRVGEIGSEEFSICIDCWIPKLLENRQGNIGSRGLRRVPVGNDLYTPPLVSLGSDCGEKKPPQSKSSVGNDLSTPPRVSFGSDCGEKKPPQSNTPEDVAYKANVVARKKRFAANKAERKAKRKNEAARMAVKLAICAIDLIAKKRLENDKDRCESSTCDEVGLINYNVEELSLKLHRVVNNSPRIAKSLHFSGASKESYLVSKSNCHSLPESKLNMHPMESEVPPEGNSSKLVYDVLENYKHGEMGHQPCLTNCEKDPQLMQNGRCGSEPDSYMREYASTGSAIKHENVHQLMQNGRCGSEPDSYMREYTSPSYAIKHENVHQLMQNGRFGSELDPYSRKYARRSSATVLEHDHQLMQNVRCCSVPDRYSRKYTRRSSALVMKHGHPLMQNVRRGSEPDPYSRKYTRRRSAIVPEHDRVCQNCSLES